MMKLKLEKLPEGNKGPLIIDVVHGGEEVEGGYEGAERHNSKLAIGSTISCEDSLGQALLAKYGKFMRVVDSGASKAEPEEDEDDAKPAKKVGKAAGKPGPKTKAKSKVSVEDASGEAAQA